MKDNLVQKQLLFTIKSFDNNACISGYASVFNKVDAHNDVLCFGAFDNAVRNAQENKLFPKFLWQHDVLKPIGNFSILKQDGNGLFIQGKLLLKLTQAQEALELLKNNVINGLSIGFFIKDCEVVNNIRYIKDVDLQEISLVTFPACGDAKVILENHNSSLTGGKNIDTTSNALSVLDIENITKSGNVEISESVVQNKSIAQCEDITKSGCIVKREAEKNTNNTYDLNHNLQQNFKFGVLQNSTKKYNNKRGGAMEMNENEKNMNVVQKGLFDGAYNFIKKDLNDMVCKSYTPSLGDPGLAFEKKNKFMNYLRSGKEYIEKSLSTSDESGKLFLPSPIVDSLFKELEDLTIMRNLCKRMTISTNAIEILVDTKLPNAGWSNDGGQAETDAPEVKKINISVHEIFAKPRASQKLLDDSKINIENWIVQKIAEKFASLEDCAFISGDGVNKPKGFLSYETDEDASFGKLQHIKTGVDGDFNMNATDILIDTICSLKPEYLSNAVWVMSSQTFSKIKKIKNPKTNEYILNNENVLNNKTCKFATLLGYPVVINNNMPNVGLNSKSIAFGNFSYGYQIVDKSCMSILRDPYTYKPFVEFYVTKRVGGDVIDFDAIKIVKFSA